MFNVYGRRRVHINVRGGHLSVRIDRQNFWGRYCLLICFSTVVLGLFSRVFLGAAVRRPHEAVYLFLLFALCLTGYILTFAAGVWGAFGVEEIRTEAGTLRWTRRALNWTRVRDIPLADITEIKAIPSWHRFRNSVEITAGRKRRRVGENLLREEALELAEHLRSASGLGK
jgi:hypothetical protein